MPVAPLGHAGGHGESIPPGEWWAHWPLEPLVVASLALLAAGYALALRSLRRRGARRALRPRHVAAFATGFVALTAALVSPLEALSGTALSAHMGQHVLLIAVAAPLLAYGAPPVRLAAALPAGLRRPLDALRRHAAGTGIAVAAVALGAVFVHAAVVWAWHVPPLYEAALRAEAVHAAQHLAFVVTAVVVWWCVFSFGAATRPSATTSIALFALGAQGAALGALMAFSGSAWYSAYGEPAALHGIDPLADQQLAALLMWGFGGVAPVVVGAVLVAVWLERLQRYPRRATPVPASGERRPQLPE